MLYTSTVCQIEEGVKTETQQAQIIAWFFAKEAFRGNAQESKIGVQ